MFHFVSSFLSLLVVILACVGVVMPKIFINSGEKQSSVIVNCWWTTSVTTDATTGRKYSGDTLAVGSPCESTKSTHAGLWKQCTRTPVMVKDSCRGTSGKNTPVVGNPVWAVQPDGKTGLSPGCLYARPDDYTCTSTFALSEKIQKLKPMAEKAGGAALDAWNKMDDQISALKASGGLYVTSIILQYHGFLFGLLGIATGMKMFHLGSAGFHCVGGLFYMITGAVMAAKLNDARKFQGGNGEETGDWDVTFAATWTCWLFAWICAALSFMQSRKEDPPAGGSGNV